MSLLEMSISAAVLVVAVAIIRALALHKLPHKFFLALWGVALLRLFVPLRIPSPLSLFSLAGKAGAQAPARLGLPAITGRGTPSYGILPALPAEGGGVAVQPGFWQQLSPWAVVWAVGFAACVLFFLATHLRSRQRYKASLPCGHPFVAAWMAAHPLRRPVAVRVSDQVAAPLTYGIFRPVILLPKGMDWADEKQLAYVLAHEHTHIRRFDVLLKTLLVAAVAVHWFNPLVWVMFVLAGRDIELACDEAVVKAGGQKREYALALLELEERKSRFAPLCTSFSKNGVEERIRSIMKMKKTSLVGILLAVVLVAGTITVFATTAAGTPADLTGNSGSGGGSDAGGIPLRYGEGQPGNHSGYSEADYAALMALKTDGYRDMSVEAFNNAFRPLYNLYSGYSPRDENIGFLVTLGYSHTELNADFFAPQENYRVEDHVSTATNHGADTPDYYGAGLDYTVAWDIANAAALTVGQRDDVLNRCHSEVQAILDGKTREELESPAIAAQLQQEYDALAQRLSAAGVTLSVGVKAVYGHGQGLEGLDEEYPVLLGMRLDGYQAMSISAFREAALALAAPREAEFLSEMERLTGDERLQAARYTNDDASFLLNTLLPVMAEKWQSWEYGGVATGERGSLEYAYTLSILDADTLTMEGRDGVWMGLNTAAQALLENAPDSVLQDDAALKDMLEKSAQTILAAEGRGVGLEMQYVIFMPVDEGGMNLGMQGWPDEDYAPATAAEYEMLLALATPGYESMTADAYRQQVLQVFNEGEHYNTAFENILRDRALGRADYPLTARQEAFLYRTLQFTVSENAALVRSERTGVHEDPATYGYAHRERYEPVNGGEVMAFMVTVDYELSWVALQPESLTVAQRDAALLGVLDGVRSFIASREEDDLPGRQALTQAEIDRLLAQYSTPAIRLQSSGLHYVVLDEREYLDDYRN